MRNPLFAFLPLLLLLSACTLAPSSGTITAARVPTASNQAPTFAPSPSPTAVPSSTLSPTPTPSTAPSLTSTPTPRPAPTVNAVAPTGWFLAVSTPGEQGMDADLLDEGLVQLEELPNLRSLIILRNDALVFERYYHGGQRDKAADVYSVLKSVTSALVGIAIREGYIDSADQKLSDFFPEHFPREDDPRKDGLALHHFLTMSAGFEWTEHLSIRLRHVRATLDLPLEAPPGQTFCYNGWLPHTFSILITQEGGMSTKTFADQYLFGPLNISVSNWGTPFGVYNGAAGLWLTPQDMAKIGQLYLHKGNWNGMQIVPAEWVEESTEVHIELDPEAQYGADGYGYYWWLKTIEGHRVFSARGYYGQSIHVIPDLNVVMVITKGEAQEDPDWFNYGLIEDYVIPSTEAGE
jgi:CubicO group peptidase (beta-lactamase class C family)